MNIPLTTEFSSNLFFLYKILLTLRGWMNIFFLADSVCPSLLRDQNSFIKVPYLVWDRLLCRHSNGSGYWNHLGCSLFTDAQTCQILHVGGDVYTVGWHLPPRGWSRSLHSASQALSHPDVPFPWGKLVSAPSLVFHSLPLLSEPDHRCYGQRQDFVFQGICLWWAFSPGMPSTV